MSTHFIHWRDVLFSFWAIFAKGSTSNMYRWCSKLNNSIAGLPWISHVWFPDTNSSNFPATGRPEFSPVLRGLAIGPKTRNHHQPDFWTNHGMQLLGWWKNGCNHGTLRPIAWNMGLQLLGAAKRGFFMFCFFYMIYNWSWSSIPWDLTWYGGPLGRPRPLWWNISHLLVEPAKGLDHKEDPYPIPYRLLDRYPGIPMNWLS